MTVSFAKALNAFGIRVKIADPAYTKPDFTNQTGHRTVENAAEIIVRLVTSGEDDSTAGFFDADGTLPWYTKDS